MALRANATLTFLDYAVSDEGTTLHFLSPDPGAGEPSDYYVLVTDAELAAVSTAPQIRALIVAKVGRRYRASGIATKLDALIGATMTV